MSRNLTSPLNRRAFLGRYAGGLGSLALAPTAGRRKPNPAHDPLAPEAAAPCREGEGRHLPVPARRPEPDGPVRPQARTHEAERQAAPGQARGPLPHAAGQAARLAVQVRKVRQVRHRAVGIAAAHREDRRRHHARPLDDDGLGRSRGGPAGDPLRARSSRAGRRGARGCSTASAPNARNCRPTSSSPTPAGCRWTARTTGRAGSCRPSTRARRSGRRARRSRTSPPRPTCRQPRARNQLDLLDELNRAHLARHPGNTELEARLGHFELAAQMQTAVPDVLDLSKETDETTQALRPRQPEVRGVRQALPAGPPAGRARRALRADLPERPAVGHAQQERREPEGPVRDDRPAERRPGPRPRSAAGCSIRRS